MAHTTTEHTEDVTKLAALLKGVRVCMLNTLDQDGYPHSRPMTLQEADFSGDLWFFMSRSSATASEIKRHDQVTVSVQEDKKYISVSGRAAIENDLAKAQELWTPLYKAFFPGGVQDPDLALLRVQVERAEYWESPHGLITTLVGFVTAMATGDRSKMGKHETLRSL